jgi:hypothetical protein
MTGDDAGVLRTWSLASGGSLVHELAPTGIVKPEVHDISIIKRAKSGPLAASGGGVVVCCGRWVLLIAVDPEGRMSVVHRVKIPFLARIDSADMHPNGTTMVLGGGDAASAATSKGGQASLYVFMVELQRSPTTSAAPVAATAGASAPSAATSSTAGPSYASAAGASRGAASGHGGAAPASGAAAAGGKRSPAGCRIVSISKGHVGPIRCLRFAPEATKFASGGEDGNIRLWSTSAQTMAGTGGMDDLPAVNDDGIQVDKGAPGASKPAASAKSKGVYRPGAFANARRGT